MNALLWCLTYLVHSTVLFIAVLILRRWVSDPPRLEVLWRTAMIAPIFTSTLAWLGAGWSMPLHVPDLIVFVSLAPTADAGLWTIDDMLAAGLAGLLAIGVIGLALDFRRRACFLRSLDRQPASGAIVMELLSVLRSAGMRRPVCLTHSSQLSSPIAIGAIELCVPDYLVERLDLQQRRAALAHELAHLRRRDDVWALVAAVIGRALFFQPLNRLARRELLHLAELSCDAFATRLTDPETMARCLVEIAAAGRVKAALVVPAAASGGRLTERVNRLMTGAVIEPLGARGTVSAFALAALLLLGLSAVPSLALPERSRDYWTGFALGRGHQAVKAGKSNSAGLDGKARAELERALRARQDHRR